MAIGERIRYFRNKRGLTQKQLGTAVGFPEKSADVRLVQYESGTRSPKSELTKALAEVLDVSPTALSVPDIDSYVGLMHTLFTLEDLYGLRISCDTGGITLRVDPCAGKDADRLHEMLCAWADQAEKLKAGEITQDAYDAWRDHYPRQDTTQRWTGVISQELSDLLFN
jgi:transcriptional regulator with XRE-family HTH domain